jgi:hypothetical protein
LHPPFPTTPPIIKLLATAAEHRFLDRNQLVVHDRLRLWHVNDNLGDALQVVFQDFLSYPPRILSYAVPNTRNTPSPQDATPQLPPTYPPQQSSPQSQYGNTQPPTYNTPTPTPNYPRANTTPPPIQPQQSQDSRVVLPPIPMSFPEIDEAGQNPQIIKGLIESEWRFKEWFDTLGYVQTCQQIFDDLRAKNMEIAKDNIKRNKELEDRSAEWKNLTEELQQLKSRVSEKQLKQKEVNERYQPQNVLKVLNQKIEDIEEETDEMGDKFVRSGGDFEQFQKDYLEKRALYHLRLEKKTRFTATYVK